VSMSPMTLNVPAALKAQTLKEFIELAKSQPGKFNYATIGGNGGAVHLYTALHEGHWYANHTCSVPRESASRARAHG